MIRLIRHWLRLPLLTKRERRNLNGFFWQAVSMDFPNLIRADLNRHDIPISEKYVISHIIDEFLEAIEWIEELKA